MGKHVLLAERLRRAACASGYSLADLSWAAGVQSGKVAAFVGGRADLRLVNASKLAAVLGLVLADTRPGRRTRPGGRADLAGQLRAALKADRRSLSAVAAASGVHVSVLSRFASPQRVRDMTVSAASALARALHLSLVRARGSSVGKMIAMRDRLLGGRGKARAKPGHGRKRSRRKAARVGAV